MDLINNIINTDTINNLTVCESILKANSKLQGYDNVLVSVSGGSDSDIVLDLVTKLDDEHKYHYVFFDTGLEYNATKEHLKYLENKYNINIVIARPKKPVPLAVKEYGEPFLSKNVSEMISRLQKYNFQWEDDTYENLIKKYPKCQCALKWWCNAHDKKLNGTSRFDININKYLKEFMIANPPTFKISNKCCKYAKKELAKQYKLDNNIQLAITGVRKAEGGIRATAYKSCFSCNDNGCDEFRPIFWYKNDDKNYYNDTFNIINSKCYNEYGLKRTGCAGCPYGRDFEYELSVIKQYEPQLYKAVTTIFKNSYEYTRKYKEFVQHQTYKNKN